MKETIHFLLLCFLIPHLLLTQSVNAVVEFLHTSKMIL